MLAREPGEQIHRGGSGAHQRRLGVAHDFRENRGDVVGADRLDVMAALELVRHQLLELPLIELRVVEGDGKRPQRERRPAGRERARYRGIEAATQVPTDGDVGAQPQRDAAVEQPAERRERVGRFLARLRIMKLVKAIVTQHALAPHRERARLERVHAAEHGPGWPGRPEREHLVESHRIELGLDLTAREQGLRFGREPQVSVGNAVEQRAHAEAVAGEEDRSRATIVDREGELSVQAAKHAGAPLLVRVHEHLGIRARPEPMAGRDQLVSQLQIVVDLAVVDDQHGSVFIAEGLRTAGDVDDAQTHVRETDLRVGVAPGAVRATVPQRSGHAIEHLGRHAARLAARDAREAAHQTGSRSRTGSTSRGGMWR